MREIKEEGWNVYNWRRIYIKFFLKYFLVFLVIILPSIFIICISWNHAKQQVIEAGQIRLQEGMKTVVSDVSKIKILEAGVKNNNSFQVLSRVKGSIPYGTYMQLRYARDYLNGMRDIYTFSPFYCVLFKNNDIFVSSYQCEEYFSTNYYGEFLKVSYEGEELSAEEFRELLQGRKNGVYSFIRLDSMFFHSSSSSSSQVEAPILCVVNNLDFVNTGYHMCAVILPENLIQLLMP